MPSFFDDDSDSDGRPSPPRQQRPTGPSAGGSSAGGGARAGPGPSSFLNRALSSRHSSPDDADYSNHRPSNGGDVPMRGPLDDDDDDGGDDGLDDGEEDTNVRKLMRAWVGERAAPSLLRWEGDVVDDLMHKVEQQVSKRERPSARQPSATSLGQSSRRAHIDTPPSSCLLSDRRTWSPCSCPKHQPRKRSTSSSCSSRPRLSASSFSSARICARVSQRSATRRSARSNMPARVLTRLPVLLRICAGRAILTTHHRHPDFALSPFPARAQSRQAVRPSMYQTARRRVVYEPPSLNVGTSFLVPDTTHSLPLTISPRSSTPSPLRSDRSSKFTMTERPWVRLFSSQLYAHYLG